jgi:hypothetical protein
MPLSSQGPCGAEVPGLRAPRGVAIRARRWGKGAGRARSARDSDALAAATRVLNARARGGHGARRRVDAGQVHVERGRDAAGRLQQHDARGVVLEQQLHALAAAAARQFSVGPVAARAPRGWCDPRRECCNRRERTCCHLSERCSAWPPASSILWHSGVGTAAVGLPCRFDSQAMMAMRRPGTAALTRHVAQGGRRRDPHVGETRAR